MSDAKTWIEERRAIHAKATAGRWWVEDPAPEDFQEGQYIIDSSACQDQWIVNFDDPENPNDAPAVVDAHNTFPRALDALSKVLELHKPIFYYEHEDSCTNTDEDHCAERHVEFDLGEYYCEDLPTGEKTCESCYDDEGERVEWPCATVQAIESALKAAETGETMEESRT